MGKKRYTVGNGSMQTYPELPHSAGFFFSLYYFYCHSLFQSCVGQNEMRSDARVVSIITDYYRPQHHHCQMLLFVTNGNNWSPRRVLLISLSYQLVESECNCEVRLCFV